MRTRYAVGLLLGAVLVPALAVTARPAGPLPPIAGPALAGPTHLHLIVSAAPPYIYDVDASTVRAVSVTGGPLDSWVRPSADGAFVARYGCCATKAVASRIHLDGSVQRLATGASLAPAAGTSATWVLRRTAPGRCLLRRVPGRQPAVPAPCRPLLGAGDAGVLMWTSDAELLVDTRSGEVLARATRIVPLHDDLVLEQSGSTAHSIRAGSASSTSRPAAAGACAGRASSGAWTRSSRNRTGASSRSGSPTRPTRARPRRRTSGSSTRDTGRYRQLPGMPAQVRLKFSSMAWTSDDRLVLLLESGGRTVLAVWRPGIAHAPAAPVQLPAHTGGSDTFVPLVGA